MNNKTAIVYSIILGIIFSMFSSMAVLGYPAYPSLTTKIAFWNISVSLYLINIGLLPSCENCEMTILAYVIIYGFIIGWIGYSLATYLIISVFNKLRNQKQALN